jgi:hypothetical protein
MEAVMATTHDVAVRTTFDRLTEEEKALVKANTPLYEQAKFKLGVLMAMTPSQIEAFDARAVRRH